MERRQAEQRETGQREGTVLRVVDRVNVAMAAVATLAVVGLVFTVMINVGSRKLFGTPFAGTLDLSAYLWMPVLTSLAMGYALQKHEHIRVSLLTENASPTAQRLVEVFSLLLTAVLVAFLAYYTFVDAQAQYGFGETATGTSWLPIWPMRFVVAAGIAGLGLQALVESVRAWRHDFTVPVRDQLVEL